MEKDDQRLRIDALGFWANVLLLLMAGTPLLGLTRIHQDAEVDSGKVDMQATSSLVKTN
ncbi:MAG: hypothetical protein Q8P22_11320 [Chloroflexota bacterium]|nr:hypothetical protein [Chloroflexota bacterium]